MFCSSCGKEIDGNYCSNCGHENKSNAETTSPISSTIVHKKASYLWYVLPIVFAIIGGVIAYFVLRKSDPKKARNCLLLGIGMVVLGIAINTSVSNSLDQIENDIDDFDLQAEKIRIEQEKIKQEERAKLFDQEKLIRENELQIEKLKQLPTSCDGVLTTESWLYPTADQCAGEIGDRFYDWCVSEAKKEVSAEDVVARAGICMAQIAMSLVELCEDPAIGSQEMCLMGTMQDLYQTLIPE